MPQALVANTNQPIYKIHLKYLMRAYNLKNDKKRLCDPNFDNERSQFLVQNSPERKFFCQVLGKEKLQLDTKMPLKNLSYHPFREF